MAFADEQHSDGADGRRGDQVERDVGDDTVASGVERGQDRRVKPPPMSVASR
jgi:hypothetical protein